LLFSQIWPPSCTLLPGDKIIDFPSLFNILKFIYPRIFLFTVAGIFCQKEEWTPYKPDIGAENAPHIFFDAKGNGFEGAVSHAFFSMHQ
jgi:hypothetical protein